MTCRACTLALADPMWDEWANRCFQCEARALAAIGAHLESAALKTITPQYRHALEQMFGDRWKEGNQAVKTWGERICAASRRRQPQRQPAEQT